MVVMICVDWAAPYFAWNRPDGAARFDRKVKRGSIGSSPAALFAYSEHLDVGRL